MINGEFQSGSDRLTREREDLGRSVGKVIKDLSLVEDGKNAVDAIVSSAAAKEVMPLDPKNQKVSSDDYEKVRALVGDKGADLDPSDVSALLKAREASVLQGEIDEIKGVGLSPFRRAARAVSKTSPATAVFVGAAGLGAQFAVVMAENRNPSVVIPATVVVYTTYRANQKETANRARLEEQKSEKVAKKEEKIIDLTRRE